MASACEVAVSQIPLELVCACGAAKIPAPPLATPETKFTCRECCEAIWRERFIVRLLQQKSQRKGISIMSAERQNYPPEQTMKTISVEASYRGEKVFGLYPDGSALIKSDTETLESVRQSLKESLDYLSAWLSHSPEVKKECIPSTELR